MISQIVIPVADKNISILKKNLYFIDKFLNPDSIFILTAEKNISRFNSVKLEKLTVIDEDTIIPGYSFEKLKDLIKKENGPVDCTGWYYQQFLKMFWSKTSFCKDFYTVWDADTFPLYHINLFKNDKPYMHKKFEEHKSYFDTIYQLLGLKKKVDYSFISEKMTFSRKIMIELLDDIGRAECEGSDVIEKIMKISSKSSEKTAFSEFETYGTYVSYKYPDFYELQELKSYRTAAKYVGLNPNSFDLALLSCFYATASFEVWVKPSEKLIPFVKVFSFIVHPFTMIYQKLRK